MEIKDYKVGDEVYIKQLFELVFKQPYSIDLWKWRFEKNPAGQRKIKLMWDNDLLIGQYAVSPIDFLVDGADAKAAHSLATMTHPDYGGRGVFKSLAKALYSQLENEGYLGVWGFPNNNSHGGFVKSLGWQNLAVQHSLAINVSSFSDQSKSPDFSNFEFSSFTEEHEKFINSFSFETVKVKLKKDKEYLNWRYAEKPAVKYYKFFGDINGAQFLVVFKLYNDKTLGKVVLNLLEFYLEDFSNITQLLLELVAQVDAKVNSINVWRNLFHPEHLQFERSGFIMSAPQAYVGILPFKSDFTYVNDYRKWSLCMGDSDVF